jgi:hypothetical protein
MQVIANKHVLVMKFRWHYIVVVLFCLVFPACITSVFAQDSDIEDVEVMATEAEKMLYSPGGETELRYGSSSVVLSKDSASNLPNLTPARKPKELPAKPADKQNTSKEDEEDSILSFNVLYYIIQKYKLQDIVD